MKSIWERLMSRDNAMRNIQKSLELTQKEKLELALEYLKKSKFPQYDESVEHYELGEKRAACYHILELAHADGIIDAFPILRECYQKEDKAKYYFNEFLLRESVIPYLEGGKWFDRDYYLSVLQKFENRIFVPNAISKIKYGDYIDLKIPFIHIAHESPEELATLLLRDMGWQTYVLSDAIKALTDSKVDSDVKLEIYKKFENVPCIPVRQALHEAIGWLHIHTKTITVEYLKHMIEIEPFDCLKSDIENLISIVEYDRKARGFEKGKENA